MIFSKIHIGSSYCQIMTRTPRIYNYPIKLISRVRPLASQYLSDMATLGIWKLFDLFVHVYDHKLHLLPFNVSIPSRQVYLQPKTSKNRLYFLKFSTLCVLTHTLISLTILCKSICAKPKGTELTATSEMIRVVRIYTHLLMTLFPPAFLAMSYVISFTPVVAAVIINSIAEFQKEVKGNFSGNKFCTIVDNSQ